MVFQMTANKQMRQNNEKTYADKSYTWTEMKCRHWDRYRWICSKTGQRKWLLFSLKLNSKRKNADFRKIEMVREISTENILLFVL